MSETLGEAARRELATRGLLYSGDVLDELRTRLSRADVHVRTAMATASADRLLGAHASLPNTQQRPFTLQWGHIVAVVWEALASDRPEPHVAEVRQALEAFSTSPHAHSDGPDGPTDADEDAAAAAIYAAQSLCGPDQEAAFWAAGRLVDWAYGVAQDSIDRWPRVHDRGDLSFIEEAAHPAVQRELALLLRGMGLLEREGFRPAALEELRAMFAWAGR